ncbi:unnamed protein product [Calypogeia fissa]
MGPKKKEPPEGKGGGDQKEKGGSKGGGKGGKGKDGADLQPQDADGDGSPAEELPPEELFIPPPVVSPEEFTYNTTLTLEQLQEIYDLSPNLEDSGRCLAGVLELGDCVFDARNLIVLEYCLGNLMFAKQAGLNLNQSLEIYDLGHMVLDLIREGRPFAEAEWLFKNRLLSRSIRQYKAVAPDHLEKENGQPKENDPPKEKDETKEKDAKTLKESKGSKDTKKPKEGKKSKKGKDPTEVDKSVEGKKSKKDDKSKKGDKTKEADTPAEADMQEEPKKEEEQELPLFSLLDVKKITPYFISTVFQHYCLYQFCLTRVHYNIRRTDRVFVETALTYPLSEAKSEQEVEAEEAARIAAQEKVRQDAYAAQWLAEQSMFAALAAEAKRLAEEELARRSLTLDEYIERAVRHRIEEAKRELIEEYEYREHFLIDKILQRQKEQDAATAAAALNAKNAAAIAEKTQPTAPVAADKKKKAK